MEDYRVLQDDDNFLVEYIDWQGQPAVKKTAKETAPETRATRLKNDVYGREYFTDLAQKHPDIGVYVPKVYESGDGYYVSEFISSEPVVNEHMSLEEAAPRLDRPAQVLANIDRIDPYGESRFDGSNDYRQFNRSFEKWAKMPLESGQITEQDVIRINNLYDSLNSYLQPRIAHGDMSPYKHAYLQDDESIAFIDFENFTPEAARYFDVAWCYTRLYSFASTTDIPKSFLASFLKYSDPVPARAQMLQIAILQRTCGMVYDAYHDSQKEQEQKDYRPRATELLNLVLQARLELLYK